MEEETSVYVWSHVTTKHKNSQIIKEKNVRRPDSKFFILNKCSLEEIWNYMEEMILSPQLTVNNSLIHIHTFIVVT